MVPWYTWWMYRVNLKPVLCMFIVLLCRMFVVDVTFTAPFPCKSRCTVWTLHSKGSHEWMLLFHMAFTVPSLCKRFWAVWTLHSLFLCTRWLRILYWWSHRSFRWTVPLYRDSVWFVQHQTIFHVSMKFSMVWNQNAALWTMLHSCSIFISSVQNVTVWLSKVKFIFRSNNKCSLGIWTSLNIKICFSLQWHHWFRWELGLFRQTIVFTRLRHLSIDLTCYYVWNMLRQQKFYIRFRTLLFLGLGLIC